jgi:hypothetical protein
MTEEEEKLALRRGLQRTSTLTTKLSTYWVLARILTTCWDTLVGCNSPTGCQQAPTRNSPWKLS